MLELHVEGMTCGHCVRAVTEAVHSVLADAPVAVDLPSGTVRIETASASDAAKIGAAITEEGYTVK